MTNTALLREKIEQSGLKMCYIAAKAGITYQCLLNKLNNRTQFRQTEIGAISTLLDLNSQELNDIFFA